MTTPIFKDRISRRLIFWSFLFFIIAAILPTKDRFVMNSGGQERVITRKDNPKIYWGVESGILVVAVSLSAYAIFRSRKKKIVMIMGLNKSIKPTRVDALVSLASAQAVT